MPAHADAAYAHEVDLLRLSEGPHVRTISSRLFTMSSTAWGRPNRPGAIGHPLQCAGSSMYFTRVCGEPLSRELLLEDHLAPPPSAATLRALSS